MSKLQKAVSRMDATTAFASAAKAAQAKLKAEFVKLRGEVQQATEELSDIAARSVLRHTRLEVVSATLKAQAKRRQIKEWMRAGPWAQQHCELLPSITEEGAKLFTEGVANGA